MPLANDSVLVTPGTGATVATELIGGAEYQVWMPVDAYGHVVGARDAYVASALDMSDAVGELRNYLGVFNGVGSGKTIEVVLALVVHQVNASFADSLGFWNFRLFRITAMSVGTLLTPGKLKVASPALPAQIEARKDGLAMTTSGDALDGRYVSMDRFTGFVKDTMVLANEKTAAEPIICAPGEGVGIAGTQSGGVVDTNQRCSALIAFRVR